MTAECDAPAFLRRCRFIGDFISLDEAAPWRLGGVLFARYGDQVAVIQKAARPCYAFNDQWALPGGMIRKQGMDDHDKPDFANAVADRAREESGLRADNPRLVEHLGPIVTAYNAAGGERLTLMVVFAAPQTAAPALKPGDHSIRAARWASIEAPLDLAPGNTLILAHLLWPEFDTATRDARRPAVECALAACSKAAAAAGIAPPAAPWDPPERIAVWSRAWP